MTASRPIPLPSRVLVAEDEHLIAAGLAAGLKSLGCTVLGPAVDAQSAIDLAIADPPDMALLDIRMPGSIDGLAAAHTLWEDHNIPSVIVTAFSDPQYIERAQQTGVFGYLLKPVSIDNLRTTLSVAWSRATSVHQSSMRITQLEQTIANRRIVEQAKWKLVERHGLSEADAHTRLQQYARDHRCKLIEVANEVIAGKDLAVQPQARNRA